MNGNHLGGLVRYLWRINGVDNETTADGPLLERFVRNRDEQAFTALVDRHGPMVLGVCRRILRDANDAEDAFQATFLVLAHKARSIGRPQALASWLYQIARRTAMRAQIRRDRRRAQESVLDDPPAPEAIEDLAWHELRPALDEEVSRLPRKYRNAIVECYLQEKTYAEAARSLGLAAGTVSSRLARARDILRKRLVRRGLTLSSGLLVGILSQQALSAAVPGALRDITARAALRWAAGQLSLAGAATPAVATLTEEVLKAMFLTRLKIGMVFALTLAFAGSAVYLYGSAVGHKQTPAPTKNIVANAGERKAGSDRGPAADPQAEYEALKKEYDVLSARANKELEEGQKGRTEAEQRSLKKKLIEKYLPVIRRGAGRFLALAQRYPKHPVAVDALMQVMNFNTDGPEPVRAAELLARDHLDNEKLLTMYVKRANEKSPTLVNEKILRAFADRGTRREIRGKATFTLARVLWTIAEWSRGLRGTGRAAVEAYLLDEFPGAEPLVKQLRSRDPARLEAEAEALLKRVVRDYADVPYFALLDNVVGSRGKTLGEMARSDLEDLRRPAVALGKPAPEIDGEDADGKRFKLSDYRGKVVLLTFSGNWCVPCKAMYPGERALVERLKGKPFAVLSVMTDKDRASLQQSIKDGEITWRCWWDGGMDPLDHASGPICKKWRPWSFPTVYILDRNGVIRYKDLRGEALDQAVEELLKEPSTGEKRQPGKKDR
jgi:RNA polymerase sigma factor (sigma-70 family)